MGVGVWDVEIVEGDILTSEQIFSSKMTKTQK
jgi:hypothetical protein